MFDLCRISCSVKDLELSDPQSGGENAGGSPRGEDSTAKAREKLQEKKKAMKKRVKKVRTRMMQKYENLKHYQTNVKF